MATDEFVDFTIADKEWSINYIGEFAADRANPFDDRFTKSQNDSWVCDLLPMPSVSSTVPIINDKKKDPLHSDDHYKTTYQEESKMSTEPLSNEEWTARRLCKERKIKSLKQATHDQNHGQQSNLGGLTLCPRELEDSWSTAQNSSYDQEMLLFQEPPSNSVANGSGQRYQASSSAIPISRLLQGEYLIHRSRAAVANIFRFVGARSRNSPEAPPRSEAISSPAWVGRGDMSGSGRNDLDILTGILTRSMGVQPREASFESDGDDDEDTAYWTTGTAMESIIESESSCSFKADDESVLSEEENGLVEVAVFGDEHLEWSCIPQAQKDSESPALPHDPFVQFKF